MASKIRAALLATAVASGLLLSNSPAHAQPVTEASASPGTTAEAPASQEQTVAIPPTPAVVLPSAVLQPQDAGTDQSLAPVKAPEAVAGTAPAGEAVPTDADGNGANESEDKTATDDGVTGSSQGPPEGPGDTPDLTAPHTDAKEAGEATGAAGTSAGVATGQDAPRAGTTGLGSETGVGEVSSTEGTEASSSAPESGPVGDTDVTAMVSFEDFVNGLEMPKGSESWSEGQWNDFLETPDGKNFTDSVIEGLLETDEFSTIVDIVADFIDSGDLAYLDELMDYLLELFDGNAEWAQEAYDGIIQELINEGYLEPDADNGAVPSPKPTPAPTSPVEKPKPEIKPAGIVKPVVDKKPIVKAVVKPVVQAKTGQLAETGSSGMLVLGGSGLLLILGGAVAMRLHRKPRSH